MTRKELLEKINRANSLRIHHRLVMEKITKPMAGARFLYELKPAFLDDIAYMTGTENGIAASDLLIMFIITAVRRRQSDPVISFILNFRNNGEKGFWLCECKGISDIVYKQDLEVDGIIECASINEIKDSRGQIRESLDLFIKRAVERGYLVED